MRTGTQSPSQGAAAQDWREVNGKLRMGKLVRGHRIQMDAFTDEGVAQHCMRTPSSQCRALAHTHITPPQQAAATRARKHPGRTVGPAVQGVCSHPSPKQQQQQQQWELATKQ